MYRWINKYALLVIVILCFVSRLPILLSENLFLDGDECIVGLMAKHFYEEINVPFFFYGQTYGFSFIEVLFIRIFYGFLGVNDLSIKFAMLLLWCIGVVFLYKTLKQLGQKHNNWLPLLITVVFIFAPSFAIWSTKARGGYLTAFTVTFIITWLVNNVKLNRYLITPFVAGVLSVVVYESQALWLAGLFPILVYYFFKQSNIRHNISLFSGVFAAMFVFSKLKTGLSNFWSPNILVRPDFSFNGLVSIVNNIYRNQTGSYFYNSFVEPNLLIKIIAVLITLSIFAALVISLVYYLKKREVNKLLCVVCFSVLFSIAYIFFIDASNARYILPLNSFVFIMFYLLLSKVKQKKIINTLLWIPILLGMFSFYTFKNYSPENKSELLEVIDELEAKNIHYVFCQPGLLQWQLMFYSNESIIARSLSNIDRYPEYFEKVNDAFVRKDSTIAMIGFSDYSYSIFIHENPGRKMLEEYGFNINQPE